jgi:phosphatidylserine/phosphatidylglycerophosphate/cardiolipin synthase-like enzyme
MVELWRSGRKIWTALVVGVTLAGQVGAASAPLAGSPLGELLAADAASGEMRHRALRMEIGREALVTRLHLIRSARESLELQTFIWTNDGSGRLLLWELIEAARRGVRVRMIVDQMFSEQNRDVIAFVATAHPNLEVRHYRPPAKRIDPGMVRLALAGLFAFRDTNQRMHNKVLIVDGAVLITGGRNVEDTYFDRSTGLNYRDRDVLATGPAVAEARQLFERYWSFRHAVPSRALKDVAAEVKRGTFRRYEEREDWEFGPGAEALLAAADDAPAARARLVEPLRLVRHAEFISDEPGKAHGWFSAEPRGTLALRRVIERARSDVLVQTPYLVLSPAAREMIRVIRARQPGLRIRISSNSLASTDNLLAYSGNYRLRSLYIERLGLEVHEFKPLPAILPQVFPDYAEMKRLAEPRLAAGEQDRAPFLSLHAKSLVVDDAVAFIGSYNLDPRSENLNTEAGLLVEDEAFARGLRAEIERDLRAENSWVIARRNLPLPFEAVNGLIGGLVALTPVDVWPIQNTASFELRAGGVEVSPSHPDFHRHYRDVGPFPGADGFLSQKEIMARLYKAVGAPLTPIL